MLKGEGSWRIIIIFRFLEIRLHPFLPEREKTLLFYLGHLPLNHVLGKAALPGVGTVCLSHSPPLVFHLQREVSTCQQTRPWGLSGRQALRGDPRLGPATRAPVDRGLEGRKHYDHPLSSSHNRVSN